MKIDEDLYFYSKDKPFSQILARGFACNRFAIDNDDEIWLIDAGTSPMGRVKKLFKQMRKDGLDPKKINKVIITHGHVDHINGFPAIQKGVEKLGGKCEMYIHEEDAHFVTSGDGDADFLQYMLDAAGKFAKETFQISPSLFSFASKYGMGKAPANVNPVCVKDGDIIRGSKYSVKIVHTPGHSEGHICPYLIEKKALFLGDLIDQYYDHKPPLNLPSSNFIKFKKSLEKVREIDIDLFCSAHGHDITRGIEYNRKYVDDTLKQLYFGYNRTIEILKAKQPAKLGDFSWKFPSSIWQLQEQRTLPFAIFKHLISLGVVKEENKRFSIIGEIPNPESL